MTVLLIYHYRLGDIVRSLPIARHFSEQGHKVFFECAVAYHGLFDLVDYAVPVAPNADRQEFDRVIDLQIWPTRFDDYVQRDVPWADYVCSLFPEGGDINMLDIKLNRPSVVVAPSICDSVAVFPCGYSQTKQIHPSVAVMLAHRVAAGHPVIALGKAEHNLYECQSIEEMCAIIWRARQVITINSAPTVIAAAYRDSWVHFAQDPRDDFNHPSQVRVDIPNH